MAMIKPDVLGTSVLDRKTLPLAFTSMSIDNWDINNSPSSIRLSKDTDM